HATPQHLAQAPGPRHDLGATADHRAHRSAQALGETERDGVDVAREIARVTPEGDGRVEEPRAVQVDGNAGAVRDGRHSGDLLRGDAGTDVQVVRGL